MFYWYENLSSYSFKTFKVDLYLIYNIYDNNICDMYINYNIYNNEYTIYIFR